MARIFKNTSFLVILTYILMQLSTGVVAGALLVLTDLDEYSALIYPNIGAFIIGLILIWFILRKRLRAERKNNPISFIRLIFWTISGFILAYFGQLIAITIEIFVLDIAPGSENTDFIVELSQMNIWFLLLPAIIGPIIEELVFRKVIFGGLTKFMNLHVAAILSALLFSVAHFDFEHLLIYFMMGLVFTFLYVKTKRVLVPILAHMSMNTLAVIAQMLVDPEDIERMREQISFILLGGWF